MNKIHTILAFAILFGMIYENESGQGDQQSVDDYQSTMSIHQKVLKNAIGYLLRYYKLIKSYQLSASQRSIVLAKINSLKSDLMNYLKKHPESEALFYDLWRTRKLDYNEYEEIEENEEIEEIRPTPRTKRPFKWGK